MTLSTLARAVAAALVAAAPAAGATSSTKARPLIALSATPAHLTLLGRIPQTLLIRNDGASPVLLLATQASFAFDMYGNAAIGPRRDPPRSAHTWLVVSPNRLALAPGKEGALRIVAVPPRRASPGDHHALVLLSAIAPRSARVAIRARIGVFVLVRVPGRIVRRVVVGRVWVARGRQGRSIAVTAVNRGNVAERLLPGQVTVALQDGHRVVAVARGLARDLLAHTRGVVLARFRPSLHGRFTAVVRIAAQPSWKAAPPAPPLPSALRRVRLHL